MKASRIINRIMLCSLGKLNTITCDDAARGHKQHPTPDFGLTIDIDCPQPGHSEYICWHAQAEPTSGRQGKGFA